MSGVTLTNAIKRFGETQVIHGVDLQIDNGEFCVFVGPSGCGKSTLLRMIAGLEETTEGTIAIGTRDVTRMDPAERGVAMVFQTYALYPHMTVEENMGFGLKMNGVPKPEIKTKVGEASRILQLDQYLARKPKALSGDPLPPRIIPAEFLSEGVLEPTFMLLRDRLKLLYSASDPPILYDLAV